jgi:transposase
VVVDHFHAIRLANLVVDQVRRRTQQATLGHRGRKRDPLYRIRKLLLRAAEQLTSRGRVRLRAGLAAGDPGGEVAVAWQGKELLRAVSAAGDLAHARAALGACTAGRTASGWRSCRALPVPSGRGRLKSSPSTTGGCSNGSTEAVSLLIKKVMRVGNGFRNVANHRPRLRLHCSTKWQTYRTARLRHRSPRLVA